jgi:hypothetical protein
VTTARPRGLPIKPVSHHAPKEVVNLKASRHVPEVSRTGTSGTISPTPRSTIGKGFDGPEYGLADGVLGSLAVDAGEEHSPAARPDALTR